MPSELTELAVLGGLVRKRRWILLACCVVVGLAAQACNLPSSPSATLAASQGGTSASVIEAPSASAAPTATLTPSATVQPSATPTPKSPEVKQLALCWTGPGKAYTVVSAVKSGTQVELMGVGSIAGWFIIRNPIYHDPCWIEATNLQMDPGYDVSQLKIYYPPPTPGPTETPVPTPT